MREPRNTFPYSMIAVANFLFFTSSASKSVDWRAIEGFSVEGIKKSLRLKMDIRSLNLYNTSHHITNYNVSIAETLNSKRETAKRNASY